MAEANYLELAEHYLKISQPQKGLEEIARAKERNQHYWYVLAQCYFDLKQYHEAKSALNQGLRDSPDDLHLLFFLVSTERRLRQFLDAERHVEQLRSLFPERADVLELYAKTMLDLKKYDEMHSAYKRAIEIRGEAPNRVLNATIALRYSKPEVAIKHIKAALLENPENAYAHSVAASAYRDSLQLQKYKEHALMAARLEPNQAYYRGQAKKAKVMASPVLMPIYGLYRLNYKFSGKPLYFLITILYILWTIGILLEKESFTISVILIYFALMAFLSFVWLIAGLIRNYYFRLI